MRSRLESVSAAGAAGWTLDETGPPAHVVCASCCGGRQVCVGGVRGRRGDLRMSDVGEGGLAFSVQSSGGGGPHFISLHASPEASPLISGRVSRCCRLAVKTIGAPPRSRRGLNRAAAQTRRIASYGQADAPGRLVAPRREIDAGGAEGAPRSTFCRERRSGRVAERLAREAAQQGAQSEMKMRWCLHESRFRPTLRQGRSPLRFGDLSESPANLRRQFRTS